MTGILQHFFIEGKFLGSGQRKPQRVHDTVVIPDSCLFFCATCGEVYARAPVMVGEVISKWQAYRRTCRKHASSNDLNPPGSIWMPWNEDYLAALPMPVLSYEFERHLEHFERNQG